MERKVLVIEDNLELVRALSDRLLNEGYSVEAAQDGGSGLRMALSGRFDLILLDVMLPERDGIDVCRDLRQREIHTPIIMLTARSQSFDKVLGLKIGANDYLTKPFDMQELLARIEVQLRQKRISDGSSGSNSYNFGNIHVDFDRAEITRNGEPVDLSARSFQLLRYMIGRRGKLCTRDELLNEVWGVDVNVTMRTVDVHITWLRQKLEPNPRHPQYLLTVYGLGYKFEA